MALKFSSRLVAFPRGEDQFKWPCVHNGRDREMLVSFVVVDFNERGSFEGCQLEGPMFRLNGEGLMASNGRDYIDNPKILPGPVLRALEERNQRGE